MTRKSIILGSFGIVFLLLATISVVSYVTLSELIGAYHRQENSFAARHTLSRVLSLLADAEAGQRGFVISGNELFLEPYTNALAELPAEMNNAAGFFGGRSGNTQHEMLKNLVKEKLDIIAGNIATRREQGETLAEKLVSSGKGKEAMDRVRRLIGDMIAAENKKLAGYNEELNRVARNAVSIVISGSILALLSAGLSLEQVRRAFRDKAFARKLVQQANAKLEERVQQRTGMWDEAVKLLQLEIQERKQLEAEVLQISEREQQRIAHDLHDGLGQMLAGAFHLITALHQRLVHSAATEASEAENLRQLVKEALEQTRAIARGLYPVKDTPIGLILGLKELAKTVEVLFSIECEFHCPTMIFVANNVAATDLYRITQEAISNAVKHGSASKVTIALSETDQDLILEVKDNGTGFSRADSEKQAGLGRRIMKYRAEMLAGTLTIDPADNGGVKVRCSIPRASLENKNEQKDEE